MFSLNDFWSQITDRISHLPYLRSQICTESSLINSLATVDQFVSRTFVINCLENTFRYIKIKVVIAIYEYLRRIYANQSCLFAVWRIV